MAASSRLMLRIRGLGCANRICAPTNFQSLCRSSRRLATTSSATSEPYQPSENNQIDQNPTPTKAIKYTSDSYPELKRNPNFAHLSLEHVREFEKILGRAIIDGLSKDASEDIEPYTSDWMRKYRGKSQLVLFPESTQQVSQILMYCSQERLAIVPQGGNTGLVGGSVPVFDEIVVNLKRMNKIRSFDEASGVLVTDAGAILEVVDGFLAEKRYMFPLDLGAKGSCQIGGNVATNAGGLRLLRYGSLHGNVLGMEMVLPDGTILQDLSTLRKNNTGYDLKQLFIGGEGTLGIITGVSLLCPIRSTAVNVAVFGLDNFQKCLEAFREAKKNLSEILSAFELMDGTSQKLLRKATDRQLPLEGEYPFYCLIETSGSNAEHDNEKLENFLEHLMSSSIVSDGVLAQDQSQASNLWACREGVPESLGHWGGVYKYDLSLPLDCMYEVVPATQARLRSVGLLSDPPSESDPVVEAVGYGHLGDGNIHLNVPTRGFNKAVEKALEPWIYEWVSERKGSISAEHGLGLAKKPYIAYSRNKTMIEMMKRVKTLLDPHGIMNPYKYI